MRLIPLIRLAAVAFPLRGKAFLVMQESNDGSMLLFSKDIKKGFSLGRSWRMQ